MLGVKDDIEDLFYYTCIEIHLKMKYKGMVVSANCKDSLFALRNMVRRILFGWGTKVWLCPQICKDSLFADLLALRNMVRRILFGWDLVLLKFIRIPLYC